MLRNGQDVHRLLLQVQRTDGLINQLMTMVIETFRAQDLTDLRISILLYHQCAQHSLLKLKGLWLHMTVGILFRHIHLGAG